MASCWTPFSMLSRPELAKCSRFGIDRVEPAALVGWKPTSMRPTLVSVSAPAPKSIEVSAPKVSIRPLLVMVSLFSDITPEPPMFRMAPVALLTWTEPAPVTPEKS